MKESTLPRTSAMERSEPGFWGDFVRNFFTRGAREWGMSERRFKLMLTLPFLIMFSGMVAALLGKPAYILFTREDGIVEYLQVVCWVTSFGLTLSILRKNPWQGNRPLMLLYTLLAIGLFFLIGEELSWGQRWFGWQTPEAYKAINKQQETNLHNIYGVGYAFKWIHMMVAAYGAFMPLLVLRWRRLAPYKDQLRMLVPHFSLIPFFVPPFLWRLYRNLLPAPEGFYFVVSEYSEVMELVLASGFVLFLLYQKRRLDRLQHAETG